MIPHMSYIELYDMSISTGLFMLVLLLELKSSNLPREKTETDTNSTRFSFELDALIHIALCFEM